MQVQYSAPQGRHWFQQHPRIDTRSDEPPLTVQLPFQRSVGCDTYYTGPRRDFQNPIPT